MLTRRISVRGLALHQGKLLCVRHKNGGDYWALPGGGLEEGEALVAGIEREMIEETSIKPLIGNLLYVQQFTEGGRDYLDFFFHITNAEDYLNIDLSKTTHGGIELEEIAFVDPASMRILPEFLTTEKLSDFIASQSPTRIFSLY
ncbi:MAG TPA: NUDIX domain-containing protein [Patescibacteria group bacterium]|jgi:ADP-ribose pyrophosphatase YjhB (NUDIX family)|nr:NUDIX domain-containing protein [Patescibacteria group bacterium]